MRKKRGKDSENLPTVTTKSTVTSTVTIKPTKPATSLKSLAGKNTGKKYGKNKSGSKNGKGSTKETEDTPDFDWSCVEAKKGSRATSSKALAKKLGLPTSSTGNSNQNHNSTTVAKAKKKKVKKRHSSNKQGTEGDNSDSSTRRKMAGSNKVRRRSKKHKRSKSGKETTLAMVSESEEFNDDRLLKQSITSMLESSKLYDDEDGTNQRKHGEEANLVYSAPPLSPKTSKRNSALLTDMLQNESSEQFPLSSTNCVHSRSNSASGEESSIMSGSVMSESGWSDAVSSSDEEG